MQRRLTAVESALDDGSPLSTHRRNKESTLTLLQHASSHGSFLLILDFTHTVQLPELFQEDRPRKRVETRSHAKVLKYGVVLNASSKLVWQRPERHFVSQVETVNLQKLNQALAWISRRLKNTKSGGWQIRVMRSELSGFKRGKVANAPRR
eukprot:2579234-Rhodomonas_salina.3